MIKSRIVAATLILSLVAYYPAAAMAVTPQAADKPTPAASYAGPVVSSSAAPLSAEEMARYTQRQVAAQQTGVLDTQKGGSQNDNPWPLVGVAAVVIIFGGLIWAISENK